MFPLLSAITTQLLAAEFSKQSTGPPAVFCASSAAALVLAFCAFTPLLTVPIPNTPGDFEPVEEPSTPGPLGEKPKTPRPYEADAVAMPTTPAAHAEGKQDDVSIAPVVPKTPVPFVDVPVTPLSKDPLPEVSSPSTPALPLLCFVLADAVVAVNPLPLADVLSKPGPVEAFEYSWHGIFDEHETVARSCRSGAMRGPADAVSNAIAALAATRRSDTAKKGPLDKNLPTLMTSILRRRHRRST